MPQVEVMELGLQHASIHESAFSVNWMYRYLLYSTTPVFCCFRGRGSWDVLFGERAESSAR